MDPPISPSPNKPTLLTIHQFNVIDMNQTKQDPEQAPGHLITDYIEVVYLPVAVCIGTCLNVLVFRRLWRQWHRMNTVCGQRKSYLLLKFNLNIADFMVLLIYGFGRFCWVAAYQWHGGEFLCRAYHFLSLIAFHMTAFVMVTIALDRLRAVYSTVVLRNNRKRASRLVRNMLAASWTLSILLSSGQWCVWTVFQPPFGNDFIQCTTIWEIRRARNSSHNENEDINWMETGNTIETAYTLVHLLTAFWIPLLVIAVCYSLVCVRYLNHVLAMASRVQRNVATETIRLTSSHCTENSYTRSATLHAPAHYTTLGHHSDHGGNEQRGKGKRRVPSPDVLQPHQPMAVIQCRSRVFRTSGLVILCYLCCWTPYNVIALWKLVDPLSFYPLSEQFNILTALIVLNSVFNPLIYGFH